jgi:signal transduction histidine kinase
MELLAMKKILIIEDHFALLEEVENWLVFEGYDTYTASDGRQGVDMAIKYLPDLIVCDILMPKMNGLEVLESLRCNEKTKLIPFIFASAIDDRSSLRLGMESGADDYITKPFSAEELLSAIRARLQKEEEAKHRTAQALDELRDNIILSLPHELRTPLNGILGFGELLQDDVGHFSTNEINKIGQTIYKSAQRLQRLIQNYLLYAELELKPNRTPNNFAIKDPAAICLAVCRERASSYNRLADLEVEAYKGDLYISEPFLKKMIEELVDNAFKFSVSGTSVRVYCAEENDVFTLTVKDQGRGMTAESVEKIGAYMQFERKLYEQQGSGLGLVIVKRLSELYGGALLVHSELYKGTTVRVTLPGVPFQNTTLLGATTEQEKQPHTILSLN